jgi:hypothetical protein
MIQGKKLNVSANISENISLEFYCEKKPSGVKESYIDECIRKERMGIILLKAGIWKVRGIKRGFQRGRFSQCVGEKDAKIP